MSWLEDIQDHFSVGERSVEDGYKTTKQISIECNKSMEWVQRKLALLRQKDKNLVDTKIFTIPNALGIFKPIPHYKIQKVKLKK